MCSLFLLEQREARIPVNTYSYRLQQPNRRLCHKRHYRCCRSTWLWLCRHRCCLRWACLRLHRHFWLHRRQSSRRNYNLFLKVQRGVLHILIHTYMFRLHSLHLRHLFRRKGRMKLCMNFQSRELLAQLFRCFRQQGAEPARLRHRLRYRSSSRQMCSLLLRLREVNSFLYTSMFLEPQRCRRLNWSWLCSCFRCMRLSYRLFRRLLFRQSHEQLLMWDMLFRRMTNRRRCSLFFRDNLFWGLLLCCCKHKKRGRRKLRR